MQYISEDSLIRAIVSGRAFGSFVCKQKPVATPPPPDASNAPNSTNENSFVKWKRTSCVKVMMRALELFFLNTSTEI